MMVTLRLFNRWRVEGNPTNARLTTQDNQRLARPGMVLDSCRNVCAPRVFAARIGGAIRPAESANKSHFTAALQANCWQGDNLHPFDRFDGLLVHFLGRDKQRYCASALNDSLRYSQPRKEMASGPAASDGDERRGCCSARNWVEDGRWEMEYRRWKLEDG